MTNPILTHRTAISSRLSTLAFIALAVSATLMFILGGVYAMEDRKEMREKMIPAIKITAVVLMETASMVINSE